MLGISTCWWENSTLEGDEIIKDIIELEINGVELEYRITDLTYQKMKPLLNKAIKVLSIHNYFPKPDEFSNKKSSGDLLLLSSTDIDMRFKAIKYTAKTIEHANELEVTAVILHLGHVDMPNSINGFRELYEKGEMNREKGIEFLREQNRIREDKYQKNLDAVLFSLDKLNRQAERNGVFLCIENRYHIYEIPSFEEIQTILNEFEGGRVRYWHDVGHAAAQENLGICCHKDLLDTYSDFMFGIHLHDIQGLEDHLPPGMGELDFGDLMPFLKAPVIKILEINHKVSRKDLKKGIHLINRDIMDSQ